MRSSARVVVIGGGIVGCSILYHLTKLGWQDVVLIERNELTSGSTWHAAAGFGVLHDDTNMARLNHYSIQCYHRLEAETGQSCGLHTTGGLYLAERPERVDQLKIMEAKAASLGFAFEFVPPERVATLHPLIDASRLLGAWFQPDEGHLDPSGVTRAFAMAARQAGAEVVRFCPVLGTKPCADGTWEVITEQGKIQAEYVVNAAGLWGREVARMAGIELPLQPMEHQYLVTEPLPELAALDRELPGISDRDAEYYLRQEGHGLLVGAYERHGKPWAIDGTPLDFGQELLPPDLDRIAENLDRAMARFPVLARAGVKRVVNGPMIWSPDTIGLLGPVPGLNNYYCATGIMTGIAQGGGLGKTVAEWIVHGEPEYDLSSLDVARFGDYFTAEQVLERTLENNATRFRVHFPYEVMESGRPQRMRQNYARQRAQGAVFGVSFGWETPLYFAAGTAEREPGFAYRRAGWFEPVKRECRTLRERGGIIETSAYAKYRVSGPGAERWLDRLVTSRLPRTGRAALAPMVDARGRLIADFTITRQGPNEFFLVGSGSARLMHRRRFAVHLPADGVDFEDYSDVLAGFSVSGPNAGEFMAMICGEAWPNPAPKPFTYLGLPCAGERAAVIRISFTGEAGYEVYLPAEGYGAVYNRICQAAEATGLGFAGSLAQNSLRLEKAYGSWFSEFTQDHTPYEAGLGRYVALDKGDFVGRDALADLATQQPKQRLVCFAVDAEHDAFGGEAIRLGKRVVGEVTSGGYGFTVERSLALGYLDSVDLDSDADYAIPIVGAWRPARLLTQAAYDPQGLKLWT